MMSIKIKPLSLVGPMGCGKSTLAPLLAKELQWHYFDTDQIVVQNETLLSCHSERSEEYRSFMRSFGRLPQDDRGNKLKALEIFQKKGELYFREQEYQVLKKIFEENKNSYFVIALGGGTLVLEKNRDLLVSQTKSIFLKTSLEEIEKRLFLEDRPSWCSTWLQKVYPQRIGFYEMSDIIIDTDFKNPSQIVKEIVSALSS
ncbi:MAG: cytidylate kinase family protein [Deltaproteobacteria bacterium]|nr:cytidylate kinase family protein [Deltaproteobacteria bacterium]